MSEPDRWSDDWLGPARCLIGGEWVQAGETRPVVVKINGVRTREHPATPFGGFKQSGFGRELGPLGLSEMTTVTAVMG